MSFILDALRKSDAERQRKSTPGFADIPDARDRRQSPRWVWVVGGLLAVNLVVLAVVLFRPDSAPPAAVPASEQATAANANDGAGADRSFSEFVAEAKRSRPEPVRQSAAPPRRAIDETEPAATPVERPAAGRISQTYSTFNSLRADGTLQLPDLHLDIHVYSDQPADRFVFINMKKYKENSTLTEGPGVREITPDGVVLEHAGTAFLLPRD
jgi:general secretion pathway protein B